MKIDLYTYCYNDEDFMPFFLSYYTPIVDRITIVDNGSTDDTLKIIKECAKKCDTIIKIVHSGMKTWDWDLGLVIRNSIWKKSRYDIIMWADLDEIIYHPTMNLRKFLYQNHYDIYQTKGYDMVSSTYPRPGTSILDIKMGTPAPLEDKYLIWRRGSDIKSVTAHSIEMTSEKICRGEILLLHYKYLGVNAMVKRAAAIKARVPEDSYCKGIGGNILKKYPGFVKTREEYIAEIAVRVSTAIKIL
jgi:glycosyltransferase involved in cell wall biosynthesis